ncbi:tape measure protein, partial [Bowmanella denitrificans]|uniref:tape measure protein n=1 Tax=Bowmanella denitrificans TaxID=366582 RepID=UPI0011AF8971
MTDYNISIKFSTTDGRVVIKDIQDIGRAADTANAALGRTGPAGNKARSGFDQAAQGARHLEQQTRGSTDALGTMIRHAHLMTSGIIGIAGAMRGLRMVDDFNTLQQRIRTATLETGDYVAVSRELYDATQNNRAAFEGTVALFQRLSQSRQDLNATNADMIEFTDTVQKLGVISGSTQEAMKFGLTQLAQAMSGTIVRAEEYNSLIENIPEVVNRIAKGLNLSKGELRQMMLDGRLLSQDVFNVLLLQADDIEKQFADIALNISSTGQKLETAIGSALARLDKSAGITAWIAQLLNDMAVSLDDMDASGVQDLVAAILAVAGGGAALLLLRRLNISATTLGTVSGTVAGRLAVWRAQQIALNGTITRGAVVMGTMTVAARGLRSALALLGGPAGIAFLAGVAIYEYLSSAEEASPATQHMADQVYNLADAYESLANKQALGAVGTNTDQMLAITTDIENKTRELLAANRELYA